MSNFLIVFIGGGLGSICRYSIARGLSAQSINFPFATLCTNLISCFILGYLLTLSLKNGISESSKLLLMTGFCGGFSTFSTFSAETFRLFQNGQIFYAFANIAGSVVICLFFIYLGMKAAGS